jgi:hypothetical protein
LLSNREYSTINVSGVILYYKMRQKRAAKELQKLRQQTLEMMAEIGWNGRHAPLFDLWKELEDLTRVTISKNEKNHCYFVSTE